MGLRRANWRRRAFWLAVVIAIAGGALSVWAWGPGAAVANYAKEADRLARSARPKQTSAETFRATICANSPCVLIEAGGLAFLTGVGEGAAEGLAELGLLRADLDGVFVADLKLDSVEGLPRLQRMAFQRGRRQPIEVFGPDGLLTLIDAANLMIAGTGGEGARLRVGKDGEDLGLAGRLLFDSGVVTVRAFPEGEGESGRIYRFDSGDKALIIAGCGADGEAVVNAARGARQAAAIIAASAPDLLKIDRQAAEDAGLPAPETDDCLPAEQIVRVLKEAHFSAGLILPRVPAADSQGSLRAWKDAVATPGDVLARIGQPRSVLDLSKETAQLRALD